MTGRRPHGRRVAIAIPIAILVAVAAIAPAAVTAASPAKPAAYGHRATSATGSMQPESVVVTYRAGVGAARRAAARERTGVARAGTAVGTRSEVVRPAAGQSVADAVAALRRDPSVASAEPNLRRHLVGDPASEPLFRPYQWGLENHGSGCIPRYPIACTADTDIDAQAAWPLATGAGVTVAVLDDGVDFTHPDLVGQAWVNPGETGIDANNQDKATNGIDDDANGFIDDVNGVNLCPAAGPTTELHQSNQDWHGTGVASVIAAAANGAGMVGVAPDARIMAVRWLVSPYAACSQDSVAAQAIHYAVDMGANVINASWGGEGMTSTLSDAIDYANAHGVLFVAAAGNDGTSTRFYPAAYAGPNVISVGAIGPDGQRASFSNYGSWVNVAAPGAWILGAFVLPNDPGCPDIYCYLDGTSFAAPHVAGVAALVAQAKPALLTDAAALRGRLVSSGWKDSKLGGLVSSGRVVDARYALDLTPPAQVGVRAWARSGSTIGTSATSMSISWTDPLDDTGIEYYRVRYRKAGASTWSTITSATTARSTSVTLAYNTAYEIEVPARDRGANTSVAVIPVTPVRYEESSSRFTWGGSWSTSSSTSYSGGKARFASAAGRWSQFQVSGRSVALVAPRGPTRGSAAIYVDGVYRTTVSLYATSTSYRNVVYTIAWQSAGSHTLKVVVKGTSGHPRVDVDAVVVGR